MTKTFSNETFRTFKELLLQTGYIHYYLAFGNGNVRREEWRDNANGLPSDLRQLVDLFMLHKPFSINQVTTLLGEAMYQTLLEVGIFQTEGNECHSEFMLICFNSILFFCNFNEHLKQPTVYFGPDSVALGTFHIPHPHNGKCLDLCAGGGIQAMNMALHHSQSSITAVEINPATAKIAEFNLRFNGFDDRIQVINQSAQDFAIQDQQSYDLIVSNTPFVPVPNTMKFPLVGHGGADGLALTKEILSLYLPKLNPGGAMEFLGFGLGKEGELLFAKELNRIVEQHSGCGGQILITGKTNLRPGNQGYDMMVLRSALNTKLYLDDTYQIFQEHFANLGANEVYFFAARVEKWPSNLAASSPPLTVLNLFKNIYLMDITRTQPWMR
jgi:release factor glutamine methyltransferase